MTGKHEMWMKSRKNPTIKASLKKSLPYIIFFYAANVIYFIASNGGEIEYILENNEGWFYLYIVCVILRSILSQYASKDLRSPGSSFMMLVITFFPIFDLYFYYHLGRRLLKENSIIRP